MDTTIDQVRLERRRELARARYAAKREKLEERKAELRAEIGKLAGILPPPRHARDRDPCSAVEGNAR